VPSRYCSIIKPVISGTIFTQFLLIGLVLGLTLINVFFFSDIWTGIASFMFVITILLQTFPFCYTCNLIMEDCESLTHAIFQSNWVDIKKPSVIFANFFIIYADGNPTYGNKKDSDTISYPNSTFRNFEKHW